MRDAAINPNAVKLMPASRQSKSIIKNLARFYIYELSRYSGEDIPNDGLFKASEACFHFDDYWRDAGHYPFLIQVDNQLAGFVLVNKKGSSKQVDWHLVEFYIIARFQNKGIGRQITRQLFNQFPGLWEVAQMPNNLPAIRFWRSTIQKLTNGQYTEVQKKIQNPHPHEMIIQQFTIKMNE